MSPVRVLPLALVGLAAIAAHPAPSIAALAPRAAEQLAAPVPRKQGVPAGEYRTQGSKRITLEVRASIILPTVVHVRIRDAGGQVVGRRSAQGLAIQGRAEIFNMDATHMTPNFQIRVVNGELQSRELVVVKGRWARWRKMLAVPAD